MDTVTFDNLWNARTPAHTHAGLREHTKCPEAFAFQAHLDALFELQLPTANLPRIAKMRTAIRAVSNAYSARLSPEHRATPHECVGDVCDQMLLVLEGFERAHLYRKPRQSRPLPPPPRSIGATVIGEILGRLIRGRVE